jgi:hypothetical protein
LAATISATPTSASVTASSATLGGTVTGDGGEPVLERGVVFLEGNAGTPAVTDPAAIAFLAATAGTGSFTVNATGLKASTSYRVRAFVKTSLGIVYSDVGTFTTAASQA